jgi:hypothetical protein
VAFFVFAWNKAQLFEARERPENVRDLTLTSVCGKAFDVDSFSSIRWRFDSKIGSELGNILRSLLDCNFLRI